MKSYMYFALGITLIYVGIVILASIYAWVINRKS